MAAGRTRAASARTIVLTESLYTMRKTKEIKRKKELAAIEMKKGKKAEAYKMYAEAKKELDALRGRNQPAAAAPAEKTTT
jgi:hypothetical protein